jgi:hypothetical protein
MPHLHRVTLQHSHGHVAVHERKRLQQKVSGLLNALANYVSMIYEGDDDDDDDVVVVVVVR